MNNTQRPVVLLLGAQSESNPLTAIPKELSKLKDLFKQQENCSVDFDLDYEPYFTQQQLKDKLSQMVGHIAILHFAGHSGSDGLMTDDGAVYSHHIATILNTWKQPPVLIFLNGCSNAGQVKLFHAAGVPLVIATQSAIDDQQAAEFSHEFYRALLSSNQQVTLQTAFDRAGGQVFLSDSRRVRSIDLENFEKTQNTEWDWSLFSTQSTYTGWNFQHLIKHGQSGLSKLSPPPITRWKWLVVTGVALAAIAVIIWFARSGTSSAINITANNNQGSISADTVHGNKIENQTVVNQAIDTEKLARQLIEKMGKGTEQDLQVKDEEIKRLTETITRLQQQPSDEYKQSALKKLEENKPQEAAELLKQSLAERDEADQAEVGQMAEDWVDVGNIAYLNDMQAALMAYQKAVASDPDNIEAWDKLGHIQRRLGHLDEATRAYESVSRLAGDDQYWQSVAYGNFGILYYARGELDKAEKFLLKSLAIDETLGSQEGLASIYGNLGVIYLARSELDKAKELLLKALEINLALGRQIGTAMQYDSLGYLYLKRGELDKADEFYLKALEINVALDRQEDMANQYNNLGSLYERRGDLNKAEEFYLKALKINEALGRQENMAKQYNSLGHLYQKRGELYKAKEFYLKSLKINEVLGAQEVVAGQYFNIGLVSGKSGDIKTACQNWQTSVSILKQIDLIPAMEQIQGSIDQHCPK